MKTNLFLRNLVLAGTSLALIIPNIGRADAAPDLINSVMAHRFLPQHGKVTMAARTKTNWLLPSLEIWKHTRTISAGQSTVAIPVVEINRAPKCNQIQPNQNRPWRCPPKPL